MPVPFPSLPILPALKIYGTVFVLLSALILIRGVTVANYKPCHLHTQTWESLLKSFPSFPAHPYSRRENGIFSQILFYSTFQPFHHLVLNVHTHTKTPYQSYTLCTAPKRSIVAHRLTVGCFRWVPRQGYLLLVIHLWRRVIPDKMGFSFRSMGSLTAYQR